MKNHNKQKIPLLFLGGIDYNSAQPDYNRGWLTRGGNSQKTREWQQRRSPQ